MTADRRNQYGFPVELRLARAQQYATDAKERNKQPCACEACRQREIEAAVIQITNNWRAQ